MLNYAVATQYNVSRYVRGLCSNATFCGFAPDVELALQNNVVYIPIVVSGIIGNACTCVCVVGNACTRVCVCVCGRECVHMSVRGRECVHMSVRGSECVHMCVLSYGYVGY